MRRIMLLLWGVVLLGAVQSCDLFESDDDPVGPSASDNSAIGVISTEGNGLIKTESGVSVTVSPGCIPPTTSNENGQMTISIELAEDQTPDIPAGESLASNVMRFGPSGFTFAQPVLVTIPVDGDIGDEEVAIYRVNPTTGDLERYPAIIDTENNTVSAFTYEFSPWFVTRTGRTMGSNTSWGCVEFSTIYRAVGGCVTGIDLAYPQQDASYTGKGSFVFGTDIGLSSRVKVHLPQGNYTFCLQRNVGSLFSPTWEHDIVSGITVTANGYYGSCSDEVISASASGTPGLCDCTPEFTPSAGTGDVQVTLTWYNAEGVDLDLHVTDPNGETVYWDNDQSVSGGVLDRDNECSNYINGKPENIFWKNAPSGKYKVEVDWYEACESSVSSQPFIVRVLNGSSARTYHGSIGVDKKVQVVEFDVSANGLVYSPETLVETERTAHHHSKR